MQEPPRQNPSATSAADRQARQAPEGIPILQPAVPPAWSADLERTVAEAMAGVDRRARLTVLVNDPQRYTSTREVLEILPKHADAAKARLLVATGSHNIAPGQRRSFEQELAAGLGFSAFAWHDCRSGLLQPLGGQEGWKAHPWLLEDGELLAVGSVEPHYFAGFTGSHKTATIGCADHRSIESNHAHAMESACRPGRLAGNPVHEGIAAMLAALEARRPVRAINLLQAGRQISAASAGTPLAALQGLVRQAEQAFIHRLDRPADAIIAEVHGPLGKSFYQADKGIKNNEWAVRDGGVFILVADCADGVGQDHFLDLLREAPTHDHALGLVRSRGYRLGDHKAVRLRYLTDPACRGVRVFLVSPGISAEQAALLGLTKSAGAGQALRQAGVDVGRQRVLRVLDAGNLCVLPREV